MTLSPSATTRTFIPANSGSTQVKLLPRTRRGRTPPAASRKVVSRRIRGRFACLNTNAGGGVGRNREAAILELLLHRQWLVQCKIQLRGGSPEPPSGCNSIKVRPRSK